MSTHTPGTPSAPDLLVQRDALLTACNALRVQRDKLLAFVKRVAAEFEDTDAPLGMEARALVARAKGGAA